MLMLITAMGAAFFIGIRSASPDMNTTFDHYYSDRTMYDIRVVSTFGLTGSNIERLRRVDGVERVEPAYSVDLFAQRGEMSHLFRFHSGPPPGSAGDSPAAPVVMEGRMPIYSGECAVAHRYARMMGCAVGDVLTLSTGDDTRLREYVSHEEYVITGIVVSPLYIREDLGTSRKGSGSLQAYGYLPFADFTMDVYTEAQVFLSNSEGYARFDDRFQEKSAAVEEELQYVGDELAGQRRRVLTSKAAREIAVAYARIEEAKYALAQSELALMASEAALTEGEQALMLQRASLYGQIDDGRRLMEATEGELVDGRLSLELGRLALRAGRGTMEMLLAMQSGAPETDALGDEESMQGLILAERELYAKERELILAEAVLEEEQAAMLTRLASLDRALYLGQARLSIAEAETSIARDALTDGKAQLLAERALAQSKLAASASALLEARRTLSGLPEAKCYVLGLDQSANFESFRQDSERVSNIGQVFPLFFFLVAALVAFTCIVRIVEDDRPTAAVMQSLGYSAMQVFGKYISYALSVGVPGILLGIAVGHRLFPVIIFDYGYRIMYSVPPVEVYLYPELCLKVCAISLISVVAPAAMVSAQSMAQIPAALMRPKAPP
ncbi:MAG: ABC transporter permease, partial [Clostridiales bacterium]|nr:ABC transporter permease [Clostridiales bacterium]